MNTILVPVDFSATCKNAMDYAIALAEKLNYKLLLLHATTSNSLVFESAHEADTELKKWAGAVKTAYPQLSCDTMYSKEDLVEKINYLLEEEPIVLIVMGTKGASGLNEVLYGSTTTRVIERVKCPVIAVPAEYNYSDVKKLIFASNYHDNDIDSLKVLVQIAGVFDAAIHIIHVMDNDLVPRFEEDLMELFQEKVQKAIDYKKITFELLEGEDLKSAVAKCIAMENADLFAISTEKRIFLGPLFNRGNTKQLAHHIQIPLLAFHAADVGDLEL